MWGWIVPEADRPPVDLDARAKQEAEKKIEALGLGECASCEEEIVKNERGIWESEFLVEYCKDARDHKHRPRLKSKEDK